jgi:hypothetical protein
LAIIVIIVTQPLWNWIYTNISIDSLSNYPFNQYPSVIDPQLSSIEKPDYPLASFSDYILLFFLMPLHGIPEPIFPFLAVSFIGNIIGLKLCETPNEREWPKKGMIIGFLIIVVGLLIWIIGDMPFDSLFPMKDFSNFAGIGKGINYLWLPWVCFITGGQLIVMCIMFRLVEFRGKSQKFADKTKIIRLFGMVPFTMYTFHRILAEIPLELMSLIFQKNMLVGSSALNGWAALGTIFICMAFIYGILRLWQRVDFIGSLEWMIGELDAYILGTPKKNPEKMPWYSWGARDQTKMFKAEWINIFEENDNGGMELRDSKLAFKFSILGLFAFPATIVALVTQRTAVKLEGENKYNHRARIIGIIAAILFVVVIIALTILTMGKLGISL